MKINRVLVMGAACLSLIACGGGDSDSGGSLAQDREALECAEFGTGTVSNTCSFAIVVRTFDGSSTPVTVPANGTVINPDADVTGFFSFGACQAPFTPVEDTASTFECI